MTTIHGGTNSALGSTGTTNQHVTHVQPGDLQESKEKLAQLGVTEELLNDLDTALGTALEPYLHSTEPLSSLSHRFEGIVTSPL